jgi:GH15 family glucan-1,4-alpha-glucosidase
MGGARMIGASYQPIEDYGLIGDMHTVALVGKDGSIDFMSFPSFDSPLALARRPVGARNCAHSL